MRSENFSFRFYLVIDRSDCGLLMTNLVGYSFIYQIIYFICMCSVKYAEDDISVHPMLLDL